MRALAMRNLRVFFRDRASVFFSILGVLIIIGLYVLFLGDVMQQNLQGTKAGRFLMDSWIMAGLLAVTSITTTLGATGTIIDDQHKGIAKDLHASPLSKTAIVGGYLASVLAVGMIMSMLAFILAEVYIVSKGGRLLPFLGMLKTWGLMALSVLAGGSMVFCIASFFRTQNAFGVASTVIGTLIGFLTGIYIPIGSLPPSIQFVIKVFPISHGAALLRQVFMAAPLKEVFAGAPPSLILEFEETMGVVYTFAGHTISPLMSIMVLAGTALVFFALGVWRMLRTELA
jgi:multidrug/hemolysin transport system permease protein